MTISQLPFPKQERKTIEYTCTEPLYLGSYTIPTGTTVKLHTTRNFGWCITPDLGNPQRIFKY